jgi:hypothetical protein
MQNLINFTKLTSSILKLIKYKFFMLIKTILL